MRHNSKNLNHQNQLSGFFCTSMKDTSASLTWAWLWGSPRGVWCEEGWARWATWVRMELALLKSTLSPMRTLSLQVSIWVKELRGWCHWTRARIEAVLDCRVHCDQTQTNSSRDKRQTPEFIFHLQQSGKKWSGKRWSLRALSGRHLGYVAEEEEPFRQLFTRRARLFWQV